MYTSPLRHPSAQARRSRPTCGVMALRVARGATACPHQHPATHILRPASCDPHPATRILRSLECRQTPPPRAVPLPPQRAPVCGGGIVAPAASVRASATVATNPRGQPERQQLTSTRIRSPPHATPPPRSVRAVVLAPRQFSGCFRAPAPALSSPWRSSSAAGPPSLISILVQMARSVVVSWFVVRRAPSVSLFWRHVNLRGASVLLRQRHPHHDGLPAPRAHHR